jgi:type 1 glutamine amidotransferase
MSSVLGCIAIALIIVGCALAAEADQDVLVPVPEALAKQVPPPRTKAEVEAVLKGADAKAGTRPIHVVLVAGQKDHGPGEHDYPAWQKAWAKLLAMAEKTKVTTAWEKPSADNLRSADVIVLFKHTAWPKELNADFDAFFARGGGLVVLHFAVDGAANHDAVAERLGLCWAAGSKFRHGPVDMAFEAKGDSPILRGLAGAKVHFEDETYWNLKGDPARIQLLATGEEKGEPKPIPLLWNVETGKGRVHVNLLGHYNWTFNDPLARVLIFRAIAWAAKEPVDRFNAVVAAGVTLR